MNCPVRNSYYATLTYILDYDKINKIKLNSTFDSAASSNMFASSTKASPNNSLFVE